MKGRVSIVAFVVCAAIFAVGLFQLLKLRFETGDVYPPYSSLRADPLGTMAFYEALERTPEMTVERDFSANNRLPPGKNTTYLHLGARTREWKGLDDEEFRTIEDFVTAGGRLVVTFFPEVTSPVVIFPPEEEDVKSGKKEAGEKPSPSKSKKKKPTRSMSDRIRRRNSIQERWGIEIGFCQLEPSTNNYESTWVQRSAELTLPEALEWHSGVIF